MPGHSPQSSPQEVVLDPHGDLFGTEAANLDANTLRASYRRLQLLYTFGRSICAQTGIDQVLEAVVDALARLVELERCFIATLDENRQLRCRRAHGIYLPEDPAEWPVSKTIVNRVLSEGVSVLSCDATEDPRFLNASSVGVHNIRSVMGVPLGTPGACTGIIYVDNRLKTSIFSQTDLSFLTALSHYVYLALRNAEQMARVSAAQRLSEERCALLQQQLLQEHQVVGRSPKLLEAFDLLRRTARGDVAILLVGETGTGKEIFAKAAHALSRRAGKPFVPVNIAALSETVVESELFGHEKGAFTGAVARKTGRWELAHGGTLFLDEIAEVPLHIQPKLLRVLESGDFERVGGTERLHSDVRLVCATNQNLQELVKKGQFREDLYFRVSGVTIRLPSLRARTEDIPDLVKHVLQRLESTKSMDELAMQRLQAYSWPGNVRQLVKVIQAAAETCDSDVVSADDLSPFLDDGSSETAGGFPTWREVLEKAEREHILRALAITGGNCEEAIRKLEMAKATFYERKKRYGL